jgi:2-isopropylmalate synthase
MPSSVGDDAVGYVRIFDTTLRDGEQAPGATMSPAEKLEVARALARLNVDVIEAGFPAASAADLQAVRAIALEVGGTPLDGRSEPPIICALARCNENDVRAAWEGVQGAARPRVHTFLATSELHMKHKLRMSRAEVLQRVRAMVGFARTLLDDVEFSPEDAGRSEPEFLWRVVETAIEAGATTVNIPDTVGYTTPDEFGALIAGIMKNVPNVDKAIISVHCHDDLGLAVANTLAGLRAGARQAEVTVNGIGERAGNCALEEVVMALHTRQRLFRLRTGVDTTQLARSSRLVASCTGFPVPPNKAIVGANAFAHESGIHQDGMLKHADTYEIMKPETVGLSQSRLVLGKHSGRHAFQKRMLDLGQKLDGEALDAAFERFKRVAERKKEVSDAELEALVAAELPQAQAFWSLDALQVGCGTMGMPTASVRLRGPDGNVRVFAAVGTGPVDAAYRAIDALVQKRAQLVDYTVRAVTEGIDALAEVSVRVTAPGRAPVNPQRAGDDSSDGKVIWRGNGADPDIVVASVKAYLSAVNRMLGAVGEEVLVVREEESNVSHVAR